MINSFTGDYRFLSNFWFCKILYNGKSYRTAEHAFQAAKATNEIDERIIRLEPTPQGAKTRGRLIKIKPGWEDIKFKVMEDITVIKYNMNSELREALLATGDQEIIEGNNWHDIIWGKCTCPRHKGEGQNHLGRILMETRYLIGGSLFTS